MSDGNVARWYTPFVVLETCFASEREFTQEEFARWAEQHYDDLSRFELLNGRIVMTPPSGWPAGEMSLKVAVAIGTRVRANKLGRAFGADQGFELSSGDTVGPDAAFMSTEHWEQTGPHAPDKYLRAVPDLVAEILSPSTASRDRGEKKAIYEQNGVAEYWIVDPHSRSVTVFVLEGGRFAEPRIYTEGDDLESRVLGARIPVAELLVD